jgi:hypothetical protein
LKSANEKKHQIHREFELYKVKHCVELENAIRSAETAHQGREKDALAYATSKKALLEVEKASIKKIQVLVSVSREDKLRMKQMSECEQKLREELKQTRDKKNQCQAVLAKLESQHGLRIKVRRKRVGLLLE